MRPSYDAFGWLVWGRQTLHWDLNTDGAPSWKPLAFLFTLPYALAGGGPQLWLWMITSTTAALAGSVFGARIAFRLTGDCPRRPWAPFIAALFGAVAVLGINGYSEQVLIANSDPMVVTLCLAAIDSHLVGRRRLAFGLLVLVSLGRPEGWALTGLYAVWAWRAVPSMRVLIAGGVALVLVAWFSVPAITSHSWFTAGDLALNSPNAIHGSKILGVIGRLRGLYALPMQLAVLVALVVATVRRDRVWLGLAGAAGLWVVIEIAFAYDGWSAVPRYLMEPAAVLVVLAAGAVGRVLAFEPRRGGVVRWAPGVVVLVLIAALVPSARSRARVAHAEFHASHHSAAMLTRLEAVIARDGGACSNQGLRATRHGARLPERAGVGDRPERRQRRLPTGSVDRSGDPDHPVQTVRRRVAGTADAHARRRRRSLQRPQDRLRDGCGRKRGCFAHAGGRCLMAPRRDRVEVLRIRPRSDPWSNTAQGCKSFGARDLRP